MNEGNDEVANGSHHRLDIGRIGSVGHEWIDHIMCGFIMQLGWGEVSIGCNHG